MFVLRPMNPADVADGMRWKSEAGWNQLKTHWRRFLDLGGDGCFVAEWRVREVAETFGHLLGRPVEFTGEQTSLPRRPGPA